MVMFSIADQGPIEGWALTHAMHHVASDTFWDPHNRSLGRWKGLGWVVRSSGAFGVFFGAFGGDVCLGRFDRLIDALKSCLVFCIGRGGSVIVFSDILYMCSYWYVVFIHSWSE